MAAPSSLRPDTHGRAVPSAGAPVPPSRALLAGVAALVVVFVELGMLDYAYERIGLDPRVFGALLAASLLGSFVNLPLANLRGGASLGPPDGDARSRAGSSPDRSTLLAVNVGGALIPTGLSLYLAATQALGLRGVLATAFVAALTHRFAKPVPGLGIALPVLVPAGAAAVVAVVLAPGQAPALAYVAGTLGTLVGADLTNLGRVRGLGAPVVSIGGAGTFDGVFLTGILAVLMA